NSSSGDSGDEDVSSSDAKASLVGSVELLILSLQSKRKRTISRRQSFLAGRRREIILEAEKTMKSLDRFEREILGAYEKGTLISARPTKAQIAAFREAARATFVKNKRVNIRLS